MKRNQTPALLREYVRQVLVEDDGGAYGSLMSAGMESMPFGVAYGSQKDLYNIFVKPFTDVAATAAGKTKELSQKAQTVLKVGFEALATTLIPVLSDDYGKIFAKEKQELDKIKAEYSDVYKANWDAFKDNDVVCAAFFYAPGAVLASAMAAKTPAVTAKLLSILSGGKLDGFLSKLSKKFGHSSSPSSSEKGSSGKGEGPGWYFESIIREVGEEQGSQVGKILTNKKVVDAAMNSTKAQQLQKATQTAVKAGLTQVYEKAKAVLQAKNIQDLQNKLGTPLKGTENLKQVPQEEQQQAFAQVMSAAKQSIKSFYVKNLEAQVKSATDAGIPSDSPFVHDVSSVIAKIKAL
jgi:hypothetical protein